MKKTLLYFADDRSESLLEYYEKHKSDEIITLVATSVSARMFLDERGVPYEAYESLTLSEKNEELISLSRKYAFHIIKNKQLLNITGVESAYYEIQQSYYTLQKIFLELIQSGEFIKKIVENICPDTVVLMEEKDLCSQALFHIATSDNGLESDVLLHICHEYNIETHIIHSNIEDAPKKNIAYYLGKIYKDPLGILRRRIFNIFQKKERQQEITAKEYSDTTIFFYNWTDYYFDQTIDVIKQLLTQRIHLVIIICGGAPLSKDIFEELKQHNNLTLVYQSNLEYDKNKINNNVLIDISKLHLDIESYLSKEHKNLARLMEKIVLNYINKYILGEYQIMWLQNERLMEKYTPSAVYSHFEFPQDILPFRKHGIPTLSGQHGATYHTDLKVLPVASEYYVWAGKKLEQEYVNIFPNSFGKTYHVGDSRFERLYKSIPQKQAVRNAFDIPTHKKVCFICDNSTFKTLWYLKRHETYNMLAFSRKLAEKNPDILFFFRMHPGTNDNYVIRNFTQCPLPNLKFSSSLDPLFTEIVQAADVVISHFTSAITEALVFGVPVIYLSAGFKIEKAYLTTPSIKHASSYDEVQNLLDLTLAENKNFHDVRQELRPFFDDYFMGFDGSAKKLAAAILDISTKKSESGWKDWEERTRILANLPQESEW